MKEKSSCCICGIEYDLGRGYILENMDKQIFEFCSYKCLKRY